MGPRVASEVTRTPRGHTHAQRPHAWPARAVSSACSESRAVCLAWGIMAGNHGSASSHLGGDGRFLWDRLHPGTPHPFGHDAFLYKTLRPSRLQLSREAGRGQGRGRRGEGMQPAVLSQTSPCSGKSHPGYVREGFNVLSGARDRAAYVHACCLPGPRLAEGTE